MKTLLLLVCFFMAPTSGKKIPRIGIIGGGIGGTSCAYFLKSLFGPNQSSIDVYEADKVGGRLSIINFSNGFYEEGGSIIHSRNKYMVDFLEKFNLKKRQSPDDGYFALYDGKTFVFSESNWHIKTLWNVFYRYGFEFCKLKKYIEEILVKFDRIYDLQHRGYSYNTVQSMLAAMDPSFVNYLYITTKRGFETQGFSSLVVDEIIMATIRANYGQDLNVQKMVGSVSVAGAIGSLFAVHSGNVQVPRKLLKASGGNLIRRLVTTVKQVSVNGTYEVSSVCKGKIEKQLYDIVIIAAPQTSDAKHQINFETFEKIKFQGKYHKTVCTLIDGNLCESYFPGKSPIIDEILTIKTSVPFNSIGRINPVDYTPEKYNKSTVWKVFTQEVMEESQIRAMFSDVKSKYVHEWLAYPHYDTSLRNDSFVLAPNLYHINAIEWAASAMEMSVIGAKNVALLAYKKFMTDEGCANEIHFPNSSLSNSSEEKKKEL